MNSRNGTGDLQKILRVRDGLAVTVGIVIGVGILRTPGLIAGYLGNPFAMLGVWVFGGVVVVLSTLVLAEMAAALPQAGGKYVYAREAWGDTAGFVAGWSELFVTRGFSGASKRKPTTRDAGLSRNWKMPPPAEVADMGNSSRSSPCSLRSWRSAARGSPLRG